MDEKDLQILDVLRADASLSVAKIAEKSGIPATTVHNRIKKLRNSGIIKNYTINIDRNKVYGDIVAFILIKAKQSDESKTSNQREIVSGLITRREVEEASIITGETDIIIKIRVRSIEELNKFILDELRKIPGISGSKTLISLETYDLSSSHKNK